MPTDRSAKAAAARVGWFAAALRWTAGWLAWALLAGPAAAAPSPLPLSPAERAWIAAHPVVRVGVSVEFPPYYFASGQGRYEGFVIDLMDRLARRAGLQLEYQRYERFGDVLTAMRADRVDVTPFTSESPERAETLRFVRPLFSTQMVVVADRQLADVSAETGFAGYRVAVEKGSTAAELMRARYPQTRLVEYEHVELALLATAAGEADLFVGFRQVAAYYMEKHLTANLAMRGTIASPGTALGPAVRRNLPELAGVLDKAIQELTTEEIAEIAAKWLPRSLFVPPAAGRAELSPAQQQWIRKNGTVRLGFDENFSPIAFKNRAGGFDGLAADLTRALAARVGLIIAYEQGASFADVYGSAMRGDIDIVVAAARNAERSRDFDFVGPFLRVPSVVVAATGGTAEPGLDTPGRWRLALLRDHFLLPSLRSRHPNVELLEFDTQSEVLQAVRERRADMAIGNMKVVNQLLEARHMGALRTIGVVPQGDSELYFAVRKTRPELAQVLRAGLDAVPQAERAEIENRWLRVEWTQGVPWQPVLWAALAGLAVAALLVGNFWRSNRRLQRAQQVLDSARQLAEEQVAQRAYFTAYVAHELRGTLGGLVAGLELARDKSYPAERRGKLLLAMHDSAEGLYALCERTLDFERALAGGIDLQPAPILLMEMVDKAMAPWRVQAELKGIGLSVGCDCAPGTRVRCDAVRWTQVLQNLVGNAVKFTQAGQVLVDVTLERDAASAADWLRVAVQDSGPGVAEAERAGLFLPFAQGSEGRRARRGAGLGLSISARIVEAMGGQIGLAASSDAGSQFVFSVPTERLPPVPADADMADLADVSAAARAHPGPAA